MEPGGEHFKLLSIINSLLLGVLMGGVCMEGHLGAVMIVVAGVMLVVLQALIFGVCLRWPTWVYLVLVLLVLITGGWQK